MRGFEVIVAACNRAGSTTFGDNKVRVMIPDLPSAHSLAMTHKVMGNAVIIRPNFNEDGFYREWRSFNGKAWQECRWEIPWRKAG